MQTIISNLYQPFRQLTFIPFLALVKLGVRKEKSRFPEESGRLSGNDKRRE